MGSRGYPATDFIMWLSIGRVASKRSGEPHHIIERDGKIELVTTIAESDHVIVRDIVGPRKTGDMISTSVEAISEIDKAIPYINRAAEILKARGHKGIEAEELVADLMETAFLRLGIFRADEAKEQGRYILADVRHPPTLFARLFGRTPY